MCVCENLWGRHAQAGLLERSQRVSSVCTQVCSPLISLPFSAALPLSLAAVRHLPPGASCPFTRTPPKSYGFFQTSQKTLSRNPPALIRPGRGPQPAAQRLPAARPLRPAWAPSALQSPLTKQLHQEQVPPQGTQGSQYRIIYFFF